MNIAGTQPGSERTDCNERQKASYQVVNMNVSLTEKNRIDWISSYITQDLIERAGIYRVDHLAGAEIVGKKPKSGERYNGIVIPYRWPGEESKIREYRLRRDIPDYVQESDGTRKEKNKYLSPPGRGNITYFPPQTNPEWLGEHNVECFIVEGEKKALALSRYFSEVSLDVLIVALPGVWNFRGKIGITTGPQGERVPLKGVIGDIERITWRGRTVKILFDANAAINPSVNAARRELAKELIKRGAIVRLLDLDPEEGINGVDDFLGKHGREVFTKFLAEATDGKNLKGVAAFPLTDIGNAERLTARHGQNMKWNTITKSWYVWDGRRWHKDETLMVEQWAKDTIRAIPIVEGPVAEDGEDLLSYARKCESQGKISALLTLAKSETNIPIMLTDFDLDSYALNCLNGILNLKSGELKPHCREDLITKLCPVNYDSAAKSPRWEQYLDEVFAGSRGVMDFVQQSIGYSLINGNPAKVLYICWGPRDTGKSTFLDILRCLFGDYGMPANMETFMGQTSQMVYGDLADLYGSRLVTASENKENDRLNDSLVKMATGNDPVTACRKYENQFKYIPGYKIWLAVNHKPIVVDGSGAIWNRIRLLPFEVSFPEEKRDKELKDKLINELPGILAWAVRGCHDWMENGFRVPEIVKTAVKEYEKESDFIGEFIEEMCFEGEDYTARAGDLYHAYEEWSRRRGMRPMSGNTFGRKLTGKGLKTDHDRNGSFRLGVGLRHILRDGSDASVTDKNHDASRASYEVSNDYE